MACKYKYKNEWFTKEDLVKKLGNENSSFQTLYNNLLKELEINEYAKEVLDRVKKEYVYKNFNYKVGKLNRKSDYYFVLDRNNTIISEQFNTEQEAVKYKESISNVKYTLEEQQEEALVQLVSEMVANKELAKKKMGNSLYSYLKQLLQRMTEYMRSLFNSKEIEIDKLKADMTLNDLANLLAYTNSKIILPGSRVEYTTPDNQKFSTYQEASNHISKLFRESKDVDLNDISLNTEDFNIPAHVNTFEHNNIKYSKFGDGWKKVDITDYSANMEKVSLEEVKEAYSKVYTARPDLLPLNEFIEKNKQFEQSKEIIEAWKKENNIQYNPEEVYSRGQGFYSAIGAYSTVELDLLLQNLLQHIEDNKKAGGEFTISAFTKPVEKRIGHLEGESSVRFVIYPKSEDIKWAAPTDVYSGSVWDAAEKVSKDKKSELLGVSFTKAPALQNINEVSPNLASIIDERSHHHNELGIELTTSNFRLEFDENVPYEIKKLVNSVNSILDKRYGRIQKPNISTSNKPINHVESIDQIPVNEFEYTNHIDDIFYYKKEKDGWYVSFTKEEYDIGIKAKADGRNIVNNYNLSVGNRTNGIQPIQTRENTSSIESVKDRIVEYSEGSLTPKEKFTEVSQEEFEEAVSKGKKGYEFGTTSFGFSTTFEYNGYIYTQIDYNQSKEKFISEDEFQSGDVYGKIKINNKEYTEQALINTKIAKLKEVAKKYPRSLITSKVISNDRSSEIQFQKSSSQFTLINNIKDLNLQPKQIDNIYTNYVQLMGRRRAGKELTLEIFKSSVLNNLSVFKNKDTYIFGEWDSKNSIFKGRFISSPNIRELYSSLDILISNVAFAASVPEDIGKMLEKKGFFKLDVGKEFKFKGEDMIKNLYFSNEQLVSKVFGKPINKITKEDVINYDSFFKYKDLIQKLTKAYYDKDYASALTTLRELGIYDYNAYRLVNKFKTEQLSQEDINAVIEHVIRNSFKNKVNIVKNDLLNNPEIYNLLDNDLNRLLAQYLSKFGIKTEVFDNIQAKLGIDSLGHLDILNKVISISEKNQTDYPQLAGKLIAYMMQFNPLVADISTQMSKHSMFKRLSKDEKLDAIGDLISEQLHKKTNTKIPTSLKEQIKILISQFFDFINQIKIKRINRNIGIIADNILLQNQSLITESTFKPGATGKTIQQINLNDALKSDDFGNSIVERMADSFILTGSIVLAEQGTIYRPSENQLHDLDWVSPFSAEDSITIFNRMYPNNKFIRNIDGEDYETNTWLIVPDSYEIKNLNIDNSKGTNKIIGYDIVNNTGDVVSSYKPESDSHTGDIEGKLIDIFSYRRDLKEKAKHSVLTLDSGTQLKISSWTEVFRAKLEFARVKDIWDYNRFIPNNNIFNYPQISKSTYNPSAFIRNDEVENNSLNEDLFLNEKELVLENKFNELLNKGIIHQSCTL